MIKKVLCIILLALLLLLTHCGKMEEQQDKTETSPQSLIITPDTIKDTSQRGDRGTWHEVTLTVIPYNKYNQPVTCKGSVYFTNTRYLKLIANGAEVASPYTAELGTGLNLKLKYYTEEGLAYSDTIRATCGSLSAVCNLDIQADSSINDTVQFVPTSTTVYTSIDDSGTWHDVYTLLKAYNATSNRPVQMDVTLSIDSTDTSRFKVYDGNNPLQLPTTVTVNGSKSIRIQVYTERNKTFQGTLSAIGTNNTAQFTINVVGETVTNPVITPVVTSAAPGQTLTFSVSGGIPPYQIFSSSSIITLDSTTLTQEGTFTATVSSSVSTQTDVYITAIDSQNNTASATVTVYPTAVSNLYIMPDNINTTENSTVQIAIGGGSPPYSISVTRPDIITLSTAQLDSPGTVTLNIAIVNADTTASITVTDSNSSVATANIYIADSQSTQLTIIPSSLNLNENSQATFVITGGLPPYSLTSSMPQVLSVSPTTLNEEGTVTATTTDVDQNYTLVITATDSTGQTATSTVTVLDIQNPPQFLPDTVALQENSSVSLYVSGGTPPFTLTVSHPDLISLDKYILNSNGPITATVSTIQGQSLTAYVYAVDSQNQNAFATLQISKNPAVALQVQPVSTNFIVLNNDAGTWHDLVLALYAYYADGTPATENATVNIISNAPYVLCNNSGNMQSQPFSITINGIYYLNCQFYSQGGVSYYAEIQILGSHNTVSHSISVTGQ